MGHNPTSPSNTSRATPNNVGSSTRTEPNNTDVPVDTPGEGNTPQGTEIPQRPVRFCVLAHGVHAVCAAKSSAGAIEEK